jgi:ABC-type multidrug transport system ATPase subunit
MPQQQGVYPSFTLERFLWYMAALKGMKKPDAKADIERLIGLVNLADARKKRLGGFSGGMKQRALIAQAMLGDPKIVILDEPTAGLDPKERIRIRNLIAETAFEKIVIIDSRLLKCLTASHIGISSFFRHSSSSMSVNHNFCNYRIFN